MKDKLTLNGRKVEANVYVSFDVSNWNSRASLCKKEDFFSKLTLSGISTLPRRSYVVFPAEACKVSLMNLRKPRESLISPNFLNFSLTFSSGLKSQTSIRKLSCSTLFTSLPKKGKSWIHKRNWQRTHWGRLTVRNLHSRLDPKSWACSWCCIESTD